MITPNNDLTDGQKLIIKKVCRIQLSSLRRVYNDNSNCGLDLVMDLIYNEVDQQEFKQQLEKNIQKFSDLIADPTQLFNVLDDYDLSMFRHILNNLNISFKEKYPNSYINLWEKLFLKEELSFTFNNLN